MNFEAVDKEWEKFVKRKEGQTKRRQNAAARTSSNVDDGGGGGGGGGSNNSRYKILSVYDLSQRARINRKEN